MQRQHSALRAALVAASVLASAAALQAQNPAAMHCGGGNMGAMHQGMQGMQAKQGMPGMRGMQGMPGMQGMQGMQEMMGPPAPWMILHHVKDLGLSNTQVARLTEIQKEAQPVCERHMQAAMASHQEANKLLDAAKPDFTRFANIMRRATTQMIEGQLAMAKAAVAARDVLTPNQRDQLKKLMETMHPKGN